AARAGIRLVNRGTELGLIDKQPDRLPSRIGFVEGLLRMALEAGADLYRFSSNATDQGRRKDHRDHDAQGNSSDCHTPQSSDGLYGKALRLLAKICQIL